MVMNDAELAERRRLSRLAEENAKRILKPGDRVRVTKCPGTKRWITFSHWDGYWMVSKSGINDYSPFNVDRVNGQPVDFRADRQCSAGDRAVKISDSMIQWLAHGERGISSETLFTHLTGVNALGSSGMDHPHDPSDLMRCEKLLRQCPELRAAMPRMAECGPVWQQLVDEWDALVAMILEEAPRWLEGEGRANKAYQRMREIRQAHEAQNGRQG